MIAIMNRRNTRKFARMKRVFQFCSDRLLDAPHPAVVAESAALRAVITEVEGAAVRQLGGAGNITSAVGSRLMVVKDLRDLMSSLAKAAKRLDPFTYPEVAGKMRMRGAKSFSQLLTRALLFAETLAPNKVAFVNLGAPADVDVELSHLITAMQSAGDRKFTALDTQVGGTSSIETKIREGISHVQQLDAIFTQLFRKDPVMLARWNVVKRATPYPTKDAAEVPNPASETDSRAKVPERSNDPEEVRGSVASNEVAEAEAGAIELPTVALRSPMPATTEEHAAFTELCRRYILPPNPPNSTQPQSRHFPNRLINLPCADRNRTKVSRQE